MTLQFGNRSNTIGANVWNLRHETPSVSQCVRKTYSIKIVIAKTTFRRFFFRIEIVITIVQQFRDASKRPRALIFDLKSNLNTSVKEETSKIVGGLVSSAVRPVWQGSISCIDRSAETSTTSSSWLTGTKDDFTTNMFQVSSFGDFDVYPEGVEMYKKRGAYGTSIGEDAFDRVRRTLEACDAIQRFMISIDLNSAFGGFATEMMVELRDECPSVSRCAFGILPSQDEDTSTSKVISRRTLNVGFTTAALAEHCSIWFPIDSTENDMIAHTIDSFTSPFRFRNDRVSSVVGSLVPRPNLNLVTLSGCVIKQKDFVWNESKLESLLRIRSQPERVKCYGMYSVFRTRDERDTNLSTFETYVRGQCRRVKTCRVSEEINVKKKEEEEDEEDEDEESSKKEDEKLHAADVTKVSTIRACVLARNSNESFEFLNDLSNGFSKKREHFAMLRYFAETGLDTEEYNDVSEKLSDLSRSYV